MCAGKTGNVGNAGKAVALGGWRFVGTFLRPPPEPCWPLLECQLHHPHQKKGGGNPKNPNNNNNVRLQSAHIPAWISSSIWTPMLNPSAIYYILIWVKLQASSQIRALGAFVLACFITAFNAAAAGALCVCVFAQA